MIWTGTSLPSNPFMMLLPSPRVDSLNPSHIISTPSPSDQVILPSNVQASSVHVPPATSGPSISATTVSSTSQTVSTMVQTPAIASSTTTSQTAVLGIGQSSAGASVSATSARPQIHAAVPYGSTFLPAPGPGGRTVVPQQNSRRTGGVRSAANPGSTMSTRSQDTQLRSGQRIQKP